MLKFRYFPFSSYLKNLLLCMSLIGSLTQASEIIDIDLGKSIRAVQKVKRIFETMQARELDYFAITEAFVNKLSDQNLGLKEKFDIIDPFWSQLKSKKSNKTTKREKLRDQANHKKATIVVAQRKFQEDSIRAKNAIQGFQQFMNMCDQYLDSPSTQTLQGLLDSLLGSHLLGLKHTIDQYMPSSETNRHSHVSLKKDEIDAYYTQDSRLKVLAEGYYIVDYIHPIRILMELGLLPNVRDWSFAENLKEYTNGSLTLDDPSVFLLDGFLYNKGIEKANKSLLMLEVLAHMNSTVNTGGAIDSMVEVEALDDEEKQNAINEYAVLFQTHRDRVESYIANLTDQDINNIRKSRIFLETILGENSQFSLKSALDTPKKKRKKRNRRKKNLAPPVQQQTELPSEKVIVAPSPVVEITNTTPLKSIQVVTQLQEDTQPITSSITEDCQKTNVSHENDTKSMIEILPKPRYQSVIRVDKENNGSQTINNRSRSILRNILDPTSSPFTIAYVKALNAMSKIDILEVQPKRKGDFRKLVRLDTNGDVTAKVFAYKPATSTLGKELMGIYRTFIQEQLDDRKDIVLN